ncbi:GIY-YIG nuclease family protein [Gordonia caeni]
MNGYVYILRCGDDSYYVGSTRDIEHRMDQHLAGKGASYTSRRMPVELVFSKECESVSEAWAIERRLHGWSRAKKEALIAGRFDLLPELSRRRGRRGRA